MWKQLNDKINQNIASLPSLGCIVMFSLFMLVFSKDYSKKRSTLHYKNK